MFIPLVISGLRVILNFPILLNLIVDIGVLIYTILGVVNLFGELPGSNWCRRYEHPRGPTMPTSECLHWKLVLTILMGISAGLTILVWYVALSCFLKPLPLFSACPVSRIKF